MKPERCICSYIPQWVPPVEATSSGRYHYLQWKLPRTSSGSYLQWKLPPVEATSSGRYNAWSGNRLTSCGDRHYKTGFINGTWHILNALSIENHQVCILIVNLEIGRRNITNQKRVHPRDLKRLKSCLLFTNIKSELKAFCIHIPKSLLKVCSCLIAARRLQYQE